MTKSLTKLLTQIALAKSYIGKSFSAHGREMAEFINTFGGTGANKKPLIVDYNMKANTLKACGIDLTDTTCGVKIFKTADVHFIVYHETMSRNLTNNAHEITILGIADDEGKAINRDEYNRALVSFTKELKAKHEARIDTLLQAVCDF